MRTPSFVCKLPPWVTVYLSSSSNRKISGQGSLDISWRTGSYLLHVSSGKQEWIYTLCTLHLTHHHTNVLNPGDKNFFFFILQSKNIPEENDVRIYYFRLKCVWMIGSSSYPKTYINTVFKNVGKKEEKRENNMKTG